MHRPIRMILKCLLLVAGSINVFALVQQCPSQSLQQQQLRLSRRTTASARTHTNGYPRRLPRTCVLQESSDSTQDFSENYLLDAPKEDDDINTDKNIHTNTNGDTQSPLQQQQQQPFARNEQWLEDATDDFLDEQIYPSGSLAEDDLESINALMVAWSRRRSTEAALTVERLLKRVVDDMHAGNERVHVNTRMYTHVSEIVFCILCCRCSAKRTEIQIHTGISRML